MATAEQKQLSSYIKNIHSNLRNKSKQIGFESAWKEHCNDSINLQKYAESMKKLATEHWDTNAKSNLKVISRIEWVYMFCKRYFFERELLKHRNKETKILEKITSVDKASYVEDYTKLKLLDVGSCYNPFETYDCFEVLALDIAPACGQVYKCDFLNLQITDSNILKDGTVVQLQSNNFHVVVFSLLIEYIPCAKYRMSCCVNAYNLLQPEGVLIIITPDSKHVGANAKYMKSWKYLLARLGFSRVSYEKLPYLHCMAFRKSIHSAIPNRWANYHEHDDLYDDFYIPQDFQEVQVKILPKTIDNDKMCNLLSELPYYDT